MVAPEQELEQEQDRNMRRARRAIISDLRNIFIISRFDLTQERRVRPGPGWRHQGTEVTAVSDSNLSARRVHLS